MSQALPSGLPESPPCPFCDGTDTEIFSRFGSQLSVSTYWCGSCRSPFEYMKWGKAQKDVAEQTTAGQDPPR